MLPLTTTGSLSPLYAAYSRLDLQFESAGSTRASALHFRRRALGQSAAAQLDGADYVNNDSVQQVMIEPSHVWLEVQSGAGAHSGCYDLFAFDPVSQSVFAANFALQFIARRRPTADVNGDGQPDVVLDQTDYYVFCYACGVTRPQYSVLAWDGAQLREVSCVHVVRRPRPPKCNSSTMKPCGWRAPGCGMTRKRKSIRP